MRCIDHNFISSLRRFQFTAGRSDGYCGKKLRTVVIAVGAVAIGTGEENKQPQGEKRGRLFHTHSPPSRVHDNPIESLIKHETDTLAQIASTENM